MCQARYIYMHGDTPLEGKGISHVHPQTAGTFCPWKPQVSITLLGELGGPNTMAGRGIVAQNLRQKRQQTQHQNLKKRRRKKRRRRRRRKRKRNKAGCSYVRHCVLCM
jgi:hypothetical protein